MSTPPTRLKISYYGDAVLRRVSRPVSGITENERGFLGEMAELMYMAGGIGLAAPQVGVSKQIVMVDVGEGLVTLVNPRITKRSGSVVMEEGCLSLPGVYVKVKRAQKINVTALNESNEKVALEASGLLSRALQHEIDHLRGRLIIDYASLVQKIRLRKKLKDLKKRVSDELF